MCFSLQRRAIFRRRNFKKWSEPVSFLAFWLENVLLASAACNASTSQLQKVVRACQFCAFWLENVLLASAACNVSTSQLQKVVRACQFCAFSLQNVLLTTAACYFWFLLWPHDSAPAALTSLLFDSPDTQIIGKTQRFATFLTFRASVPSFFWLSRDCIFFLLTLLLFYAFHLLTLLLCPAFSTVHIVGS